jgi:RHS repeat-associated protein
MTPKACSTPSTVRPAPVEGLAAKAVDVTTKATNTTTQTTAHTTTYLYNDDQQLHAELNAQGQVLRQYVYLGAGSPAIAVLDTPSGSPLTRERDLNTALGQAAQAVADLGTVASAWFTVWFGNDSVTFIHSNHLGAPLQASNTKGQLVWQADYAPFGAARVVNAGLTKGQSNVQTSNAQTFTSTFTSTFTLNLRLPGQYYDAETRLHYNGQRYYAPSLGQYISPDPLGNPDGPNPYAYVAYNPLKYVDPDGLILFAFDGTNNNKQSQTNVFHFMSSYQNNDERDVAGAGTPYYIDGPGVGSSLDGALAVSMTGKINTQLAQLNTYVAEKWKDEKLQGKTFNKDNPMKVVLDIVAFSRGSAAARDFANQVVNRARRGYYRQLQGVGGGCLTVEIRFMGLFDTVASTNISSLNLAIPDAVQYVSHAVAVNEHRARFGGESIERFADAGFSSNRTERGFIGAHSDVGGAYDCVAGSPG